MGAGPVDETALFTKFVAAQGRDRGPAAGPASHPDDGGVSAPAPGAGAGWRYRESGFVLEDDPGPARRRRRITVWTRARVQR